jgi:ankyrin repeat protein
LIPSSFLNLHLSRTVTFTLQYEADPNAQSNKGVTPLHRAASNGYENICSLLIENKANVNSKNSFGQTALHSAAHYGHEYICRLLLKHGADPKIKDKDSQTPSKLAKSSSDIKDEAQRESIIQILTEAERKLKA